MKINPHTCPICKEKNLCLNLGETDKEKACWCNEPSIKFPEELLSQVSPELRKKACICKKCALAFQEKMKN